jgi:hypothetical protein
MIPNIISDLEKKKISNINDAYTNVKRLEKELEAERNRAEKHVEKIRNVFEEYTQYLRKNEGLLDLFSRTDLQIDLDTTLRAVQQSGAINSAQNQSHTIDLVCKSMTKDQFKALHGMLVLDSETRHQEKLEAEPILKARLGSGELQIFQLEWQIMHPTTGKSCRLRLRIEGEPLKCKVSNMGLSGVFQLHDLLRDSDFLSITGGSTNDVAVYKSKETTEVEKYKKMESAIQDQKRLEQQFSHFKDVCALYQLDIDNPIKQRALKTWFTMLKTNGPVSLNTWIEANNQLFKNQSMISIDGLGHLNDVLQQLSQKQTTSLETKRILNTNVLQLFPNLDPRDAFNLSVKFYTEHVLPEQEKKLSTLTTPSI